MYDPVPRSNTLISELLRDGSSGAEIPTQGTAILTFSLEPGQVDALQEGWKADVLRGLGMRATGERFEVATRLSVKEAGR